MLEPIIEIINNVFLQTWLGAVIGHVLSFYKPEFRRSIPFLENFFPNRSELFYFRLDFLLLPLIGAVFGFIFLNPQDAQTSLFTGLTWSGTLLAILKTNDSSKLKIQDNGNQ